MIFILGSFILGASLIKIYFRKYKKNEYILDIDELIKNNLFIKFCIWYFNYITKYINIIF